jgi:hypothetical protein
VLPKLPQTQQYSLSRSNLIKNENSKKKQNKNEKRTQGRRNKERCYIASFLDLELMTTRSTNQPQGGGRIEGKHLPRVHHYDDASVRAAAHRLVLTSCPRVPSASFAIS